ncbi:dihydrofolate reductase family protein [Thermoflavimicrobium dichotomicum]|uniref:Dihydrofolate reductase n=1 Tax=Thermoflavimicrobium dichotomicum TaxID=46223 RepID=A0A1I3PCY0_9BACL|nr:dihydrofolate reductase family protein [Thermoflavimicrobium dichotomicum]SFJ18876.1 Dihydrofolate reductase [Thermoflavimicrobium dichotomicum]
MDRKVIVFIAMSLDGYIARENGSIDWLLENAPTDPEEYGYSDFYKTIDTVIMGKATYDQLPELSDSFPYADKKCYVFSRTASGRDEHVEFVNEEIGPFVEKLKSQPGAHIWLVGGGELIEGFMEANVVDEFMIGVIPVLIGKGIPLFKKNNRETRLKLKKHFRFGDCVMLHYEVRAGKPSPSGLG